MLSLKAARGFWNTDWHSVARGNFEFSVAGLSKEISITKVCSVQEAL